MDRDSSTCWMTPAQRASAALKRTHKASSFMKMSAVNTRRVHSHHGFRILPTMYAVLTTLATQGASASYERYATCVREPSRCCERKQDMPMVIIKSFFNDDPTTNLRRQVRTQGPNIDLVRRIRHTTCRLVARSCAIQHPDQWMFNRTDRSRQALAGRRQGQTCMRAWRQRTCLFDNVQ